MLKLEQQELGEELTEQHSINHWGLADAYASKLKPMIPNVSTTSDYEDYIKLKEAFEIGFLEAYKLLK